MIKEELAVLKNGAAADNSEKGKITGNKVNKKQDDKRKPIILKRDLWKSFSLFNSYNGSAQYKFNIFRKDIRVTE